MEELSLADIAVIVIREDEQAAVIRRLPSWQYLPCKNRAYTVADVPASTEGHFYRIAVVASEEQGPGYAQKAAENAIADLPPQWLAIVGIAGAVPDSEFTLGDVVVAARVHDFSVSAAVEDARGQHTEELNNQGGPMAGPIRDLVKLIMPLSERDAQGWNNSESVGVSRPPVDLSSANFYGSDEWRTKISRILGAQFQESARKVPLVTSRSIASSGALIKDTETLQQFIDSSRELRAVEMELGGVYKAARQRDHEYPILAVRGISDVVGFKRDPGWTLYACNTAAAFFFALLHVMPAGFVASRPSVTRLTNRRQPRFEDSPKASDAQAFDQPSLIAAALGPGDQHVVAQTSRPTLVKAAYVIGGVTGETDHPDFEESQLGYACTQLGETIARSGADLIVCSPFADAADHHVVRGFVKAGVGGKVQFHSPRHELVLSKRRQLEDMLGKHNTRFVDYFYPQPENDESWGQAWLLCQLQALEYADVVLAVGGRVSKTAMTLLHLAEARRLPIVPFAFMKGAASRVFERRDWKQLYPGLDSRALQREQGISQAMVIADRLVADRISGRRRDSIKAERFFLSRAAADSAPAEALADYLKQRGLAAVIGDWTIRDERMVQSTIEDAILQSDIFIVFWSQAYAVSRWCYDELDLALERERVGELQIWIFNLDGSDIVPRGARHLAPIRVRTPIELVQAISSLL